MHTIKPISKRYRSMYKLDCKGNLLVNFYPLVAAQNETPRIPFSQIE